MGHRLHVDGAGWTWRQVQVRALSHEKANHREEGIPGQSQSLHQEEAQDSLPELSIHNHQEMTEVHSAGITNR